MARRVRIEPRKYRAIVRADLERLPELKQLGPERLDAMRAVSAVLPFRTNSYVVEELIRWQDVERMHGEELILPFTYDYVAWPDVESTLGLSREPSRFSSDYEGLFSSMRLEGLLNNRRYNLREIISFLDELETRTRVLIERLNDQLDE